jgi:hypothetical protein
MKFLTSWRHLFPGGIGVNFGILLERLAAQIRARVRNGDVTERGLARLAGLSQPHVHNVLKGARAMSPDSADRLMKALGLSARDLLAVPEAEPPCASCQYRPAAASQPRSRD